MVTKTDINRYLYYEFDMDMDDEPLSSINEEWPFKLNLEGSFEINKNKIELYKFNDFSESYYLTSGQGLSYFPVLDFDLDTIRRELLGSYYILSQDFSVMEGENESGDPAIAVKEKAINELAKQISDEVPTILEGLYFFETKTYLALVQYPNETTAHLVSKDYCYKDIAHETATPFRRLSIGLGLLIENGVAPTKVIPQSKPKVKTEKRDLSSITLDRSKVRKKRKDLSRYNR